MKITTLAMIISLLSVSAYSTDESGDKIYSIQVVRVDRNKAPIETIMITSPSSRNSFKYPGISADELLNDSQNNRHYYPAMEVRLGTTAVMDQTTKVSVPENVTEEDGKIIAIEKTIDLGTKISATLIKADNSSADIRLMFSDKKLVGFEEYVVTEAGQKAKMPQIATLEVQTTDRTIEKGKWLICGSFVSGDKQTFLLISLLGGDTECAARSFSDSDILNLNRAHLKTVLKKYEEVSGLQVDVAEGVSSAAITLQTNRVSATQQKELIEQKLAGENIGLFKITDDRAVATWLVPETNPARKYLNQCRAEKRTVALGNFGWSEVREYWSRVPELQELRDEFEKADEELGAMLMQDEEYRQYTEKLKDARGDERTELIKARSMAHSRLLKENKACRQAQNRRNDALYISNIETLAYIINDYEKQGKEFPIDWIGKR
jgi:hypothetical protein